MSSSEADQVRIKPLCAISIYRHFSHLFVDKASAKMSDKNLKFITIKFITIKPFAIIHMSMRKEN